MLEGFSSRRAEVVRIDLLLLHAAATSLASVDPMRRAGNIFNSSKKVYDMLPQARPVLMLLAVILVAMESLMKSQAPRRIPASLMIRAP